MAVRIPANPTTLSLELDSELLEELLDGDSSFCEEGTDGAADSFAIADGDRDDSCALGEADSGWADFATDAAGDTGLSFDGLAFDANCFAIVPVFFLITDTDCPPAFGST